MRDNARPVHLTPQRRSRLQSQSPAAPVPPTRANEFSLFISEYRCLANAQPSGARYYTGLLRNVRSIALCAADGDHVHSLPNTLESANNMHSVQLFCGGPLKSWSWRQRNVQRCSDFSECSHALQRRFSTLLRFTFIVSHLPQQQAFTLDFCRCCREWHPRPRPRPSSTTSSSSPSSKIYLMCSLMVPLALPNNSVSCFWLSQTGCPSSRTSSLVRPSSLG